MAWYALYNWFIPWRKSSYTNWVWKYKSYLYDEWFNSLSEEEQERELKRQRVMREKRKHDGEKALAALMCIHSVLNEFTHGKAD